MRVSLDIANQKSDMYLEPLGQVGSFALCECLVRSERSEGPEDGPEVAVTAELPTRMEQRKRRNDSAQKYTGYL